MIDMSPKQHVQTVRGSPAREVFINLLSVSSLQCVNQGMRNE